MRDVDRVVVAAFVMAACAKDLSDLEPYPCAHDLSCPQGLACVADVCTVAVVDSLGCEDNAVTCPAGLGCYANACEATCTSDASCGSGRLCAPTPVGSADSPSCVLDCTTDAAICPAGFTCSPRFTDTSNVCLPGSTTLPSCVDVVSVQSCLSELCGTNEDFTVPCVTGSSSGNCFFNDTCEATMASPCTCPVADTLCDGTTQSTTNPCTIGSNGNPQCMCITPADLAPTCTSNHFQSQGACACVDGQQVAYSCGEMTTCEQDCAQAN